MKSELNDAHEDLETFLSEGNHFITELKNLPEDAAEPVRAEMNAVVDQWNNVRILLLFILLLLFVCVGINLPV